MLLLLLWNGTYAQGPNEIDDPNLVWEPLKEIKYIGFSKADSTRHSYQFYGLDENRQPITMEQSHQYAFLWDFGQGRTSIDASPVVIFEHEVPDSVSLRLTALKQVSGPILGRRFIKGSENNCSTTYRLAAKTRSMRRGHANRDALQPSIRFMDPGFLPVPGRCISYLVEITLPTNCALGSTVTIDDFAPGSRPESPNQLTIKQVTPDPAIRVTSIGAASVTLQAGPATDATYYVLLECELGPDAVLKSKLRWQVRGVFDPPTPSAECRSVPVELNNEFELTGSLDPAELACLNTRPLQTGDTAYWHLTIKNEGPGDEALIAVTDLVPSGFDFAGTHATRCYWAGKEIEVTESHSPISRRVFWTIQPLDHTPLKAGEKVDLYFQAPVTAHWDCPKRRLHHCEAPPAAKMEHGVTVKFFNATGEPEKVKNDDLRLLCRSAKLHKIKVAGRRQYCAVKAAAATVGVAGAAILIKKIVHPSDGLFK